jgi:hypothetical protein
MRMEGWGMVRGRVAVVGCLLAILVLTAACSTPELVQQPKPNGTGPAGSTPDINAPRQDAALRGTVSLGGGPAAGQPISVVRTRTGIPGTGALAAVLTLGLACVADRGLCSAPKVVDSAVTDANGAYQLTLPKSYLPGYETNDDWITTAQRPAAAGEASGAVSSFEIEVNTAVEPAPPHQLLMSPAPPSPTPSASCPMRAR